MVVDVGHDLVVVITATDDGRSETLREKVMAEVAADVENPARAPTWWQ